MNNTINAPFQIINEYGKALKTYDDGVGPLWVLRDSTGIVGVVRASTWEEAYSIAEDELFPEADFATWEDIAKDCDCTDPEALMDSAIFQENYGFCPNGRNDTDVHGHGIYARDLNGEDLERLDDAGFKSLELGRRTDGKGIHQFLVTVSSRFKITLATVVHAARSAATTPLTAL